MSQSQHENRVAATRGGGATPVPTGWRLLANAISWNQGFDPYTWTLAEAKLFFNPTGSGTPDSQSIAVVATSESSAQFAAIKINDGDLGTRWSTPATPVTTPQSVTFPDMEGWVHSVVLDPFTGLSGLHPESIWLQYTLDGTTWINYALLTTTNTTSPMEFLDLYKAGDKVYARFDSALIGGDMTLSSDELTASKTTNTWETGYLTTRPTTGLFGFSITNPITTALGPLGLFGIARTPTTAININSIVTACAYTPHTGDWYRNNAVESADFWDTNLAAKTYAVIYDADNELIGFEDSNGDLKLTTLPPTSTGLPYIGISMYGLFDTVLNSSEDQPAAVESLFAAYELAEGVTIKRGLYTVVEAFNPTDVNLPMALWLDMSDATTIFKDLAGLVPVTADLDLVRRINDKSGNGNNFLLNGTDAGRPIYRTEILNGLSVLMSGGTPTGMLCVNNLGLTQPYTWIVVVRYANTATQTVIDGSLRSIPAHPNTNRFRMYAGSFVDILNPADTAAHIHMNTFNGGSSEGRVDGGADLTTTSPNTMGVGVPSLFSYIDGTTNSMVAGGYVSEVLLYDGAITDADMESLRADYFTKNGITTTPIT